MARPAATTTASIQPITAATPKATAPETSATTQSSRRLA